jgi:hypothetical protein
MRGLLLIFALSLILLAAAARANPAPDLLAVDSAFVNGQYEAVELLGLRILNGGDSLTGDERARVNLTCGYALIMLGRENEARTYFSHALDAVPGLILDPVQVSPKFRVVFDEVKASRRNDERGTMKTGERIAKDPVRSNVRPPSSQPLLSNLILPGSGQWQEGARLRGALVFTVQAAAVGAFIWRLSEARDSHEDYLAETDPARIAAAYDTYDRDYRWAWTTGIAMGLVYIGAQADLIHLQSARKSLSFAPMPDGGRLSLAFRW